MLLNMELKNYEVFYENLEQRVIDEICKRQMQEQVFVSSFNHISMQHFKELCPDIETGLLYDKPYLDEYSARDCAPQPLKLSIHSGGIEHPCRCR